MGRFTDDKPLPAMPANGMPGITSSLDGDADDDYGNGAHIESQQWGSPPMFSKVEAADNPSNSNGESH